MGPDASVAPVRRTDSVGHTFGKARAGTTSCLWRLRFCWEDSEAGARTPRKLLRVPLAVGCDLGEGGAEPLVPSLPGCWASSQESIRRFWEHEAEAVCGLRPSLESHSARSQLSPTVDGRSGRPRLTTEGPGTVSAVRVRGRGACGPCSGESLRVGCVWWPPGKAPSTQCVRGTVM